MSSCDEVIAALNATVAELQSQLDATVLGTDAEADPCASEAAGYSFPLHIGAVFIILAASFLGVASTLAGKHWSLLRLNHFIVVLGKTAGTGIVLACALVHMLQPSNDSLTSPCVPTEFNTDYPAYAYLFAMLSALAMHTAELSIVDWLSNRKVAAAAASPAAVCSAANCPAEPLAVIQVAPTSGVNADSPTPDHDDVTTLHTSHEMVGHSHGHGFTGAATHPLVEVLFAEFGFTVHSIFIGLAVGVVGDDDLKGLLVALVFHQFFEGVALGARLCSSTGFKLWMDVLMASVFAVAAPLGIAVGVGMVKSGGLSTSGPAFLLTQGTFDGICAGILLHIGFCLLIKELPRDLASLSSGAGTGGTTNSGPEKAALGLGRGLQRSLVFASLWGGAGLMAFIGKYL